MSNRGNSPRPDPRSKCPNPKCRRYFDPTNTGSCPHCGYRSGDLEKYSNAEWDARVEAKLDALFDEPTMMRPRISPATDLRRAGGNYIIAPADAWDGESSEAATWVAGEAQQLLPSDIVLRFFWHGGPLYVRAGYAVQRGDKIVAELTTIMG